MSHSSSQEFHNDVMTQDDEESLEYQDTKELRGDRYKNIIAHMDLLWHHETGPDGCHKCTYYEKILTKAFDEICEMSGRGDMLRNDFCSYHPDEIKDLED
jgi:hypothetical protein